MNFPKQTCTDISKHDSGLSAGSLVSGYIMPIERLSPKVGSIPAFHSVQQNINSLLKYFPYVYMPLSEQNRTEHTLYFLSGLTKTVEEQA